MTTTIKNSDNETITFSDEGFDVSGWVQIEFEGKTVDFHIKELMPALIGFDAKYSRETTES